MCLGIFQMAKVFLVWRIYSFVALEKGYRMSAIKKNVHSTFEYKNVSKDEKKVEKVEKIICQEQYAWVFLQW